MPLTTQLAKRFGASEALFLCAVGGCFINIEALDPEEARAGFDATFDEDPEDIFGE